jgi:hypothetical protein
MADIQGPGPEPTTFKDRNLALQHLARELLVLNAWNKSHKQGDSQDGMADVCGGRGGDDRR